MSDDFSYDQEFAVEVFGELADAVDEETSSDAASVDDETYPVADDETYSADMSSEDDVTAAIDDELEALQEELLATPPVDAFSDAFDAAMAEHVIGDPKMTVEVGDAVDARRIEEHVPVLAHKPKSEPKFRDWQIDSGQVFGPANGETVITLKPQCRFRCEKIMATDDSSNPGTGTRILSVTVGNKVQKVGAGGRGSLTQFFSQTALGNGIRFDTASPWASIQIRVLFTQQCNFEITLFGTAEEDE